MEEVGPKPPVKRIGSRDSKIDLEPIPVGQLAMGRSRSPEGRVHGEQIYTERFGTGSLVSDSPRRGAEGKVHGARFCAEAFGLEPTVRADQTPDGLRPAYLGGIGAASAGSSFPQPSSSCGVKL